MSRGQGRLYRQPGSTVWWLDYSVRGRRHRESSGTTSHKAAADTLRERIGDRKAGKLVEHPEDVTFADLRKRVEDQYQADKCRSLDRVKLAFSNLEKFFGEYCAPDITRKALEEYKTRRAADGVSNGTIRYELAALRRAFRLMIEDESLAVMPKFKLPKASPAREGFFTEGELAAVLLELPADVRDLVTFLHGTGWRRNEARLLTWSQVDRDATVIRLEAARSKNGQARTLPYGAAAPLRELLERRWEQRDGLFVFHRRGEAIGVGALRSAWKRATKRGGVANRLVHDLRRSAVRNLERAGVARSTAMQLTGHKTEEVYRRYAIVAEPDLENAMAKRFAPKAAESPASTA